MSPNEYKTACNCPNAFRRSVLTETISVLRAGAPELVPVLEQALSQPPVEKPLLHTGENWNSFVRVNISLADAETIQDVFVSKEAEAVSPEGNTTALASRYAGIADAWTDYLFWLHGAAVSCST